LPLRHGHPYTELQHPSLPVPHDFEVKAGISSHSGVLTSEASHHFRPWVPAIPLDRLTAEDLLLHCNADDDDDRFLNAELSDIQPHLDHISDRGLIDTLKHGNRNSRIQGHVEPRRSGPK
jgi:hypothetical protein